MKFARVYVVGLLAVCAVTAFEFGSRTNRRQRAEQYAAPLETRAVENTDRDEAMPRLTAQIAALQLQVARLNSAANAVPSSTVDTPSEAAVAEGALSPAEQRAADEQKRRARMEIVEAAFRKEPSNQNWAAATQGSIQAAMQAEDVRLQARSMECRSETCRVELLDDGSAANREGLENLPRAVGGILPLMQIARTDDAGGHHTVVYLSRNLPSAQQ